MVEPRGGKRAPLGDANGPGRIDDAFVDRLGTVFRHVPRYCRLHVSGLENVPAGRALVVANHTGWAGLDFTNLFLTVRDELDRDLYTAVHPSWFSLPGMRDASRKLGFFEASVSRSVQVLDRGDLVLFFPEAEDGNFKPIWQLYQLQRFQPGFARVALAAAADVVPVVIVGGEEANPSLARLDFTKESLGFALPLPANLLPLPVKWRIRFLEPIPIKKYLSAEMADADAVEALRHDAETLMRGALVDEVKARGDPFF